MPLTAEQAMASLLARAALFTEIVAHASPTQGNNLDRAIVNSARKISRDLHHAGAGRFGPPPLPESASGIPITRRRT